MRSPPTPKNSSCSFNVARAPSPARRRKASISSAPYISPEASPAEMRIRTEGIVKGDDYLVGTNHVATAALGCPVDSKSRQFLWKLSELICALAGGTNDCKKKLQSCARLGRARG